MQKRPNTFEYFGMGSLVGGSMKKKINMTARYIIGIWGLVLLFLLACVFQEENRVADWLTETVFILFLCVSAIFFATYIIHLFWMIKEKRKPKNLKSDLVFMMILLLSLCAYDISKGVFSWQDVWKKMVYVIVLMMFSGIAQYVYSWKE